MQLKPALLLFLLSGLSLTQDAGSPNTLYEYKLHNFKSFWTGSGAAIQYPGRMLLSSDKLKFQSGALTTMDLFDVGSTFSTEVTLDYHITEKEATSQSFIFAMTENNAPVEKMDPMDDSYLPLPQQFKGFIMYIRDFETVHSGWFSTGNVTKEEVLSRGKVCKISARNKNQLRFLVKYQNRIMNLYFEDVKDGSLRLCGQFTDITIPRNQYIIASASDDMGYSQISISKWLWSADTKLEIVPADQKRLGDSFYAYWDEEVLVNPSAEISNFKATALYYYDNSKIYSEELIQLADKNMADIKSEFAGELGVTSERIKSAIEVIGREADQLEALGWILTQTKNKHKYNTIEVLDMTLNWLESIEESIDKTDAETRMIYDLISKLNFESAANDLLFKTENLISNLKKLNFKASFLSKEESLKFLEDESVLKDWKDSIKDFQSQVRDKIKQGQEKVKGSTSSMGISVVWLAGIVVLCGFVWIYWKLKKALDQSSSGSF
jgi:hypothetical protein